MPDAQLLDKVKDRREKASTATDEQVALVRQVGGGEMVGTNALTREVAILEMCIQRERAADEMVHALLIQSTLAATDASITRLNEQIGTFTEKADQGTNRLATWTMVLAFATAALVLAAFVQAWVMWAAE